MLLNSYTLGIKIHAQMQQNTVMRRATSLGPRQPKAIISRRVGLVGSLTTIFLGLSHKAGAEPVELQFQAPVGEATTYTASDAFEIAPRALAELSSSSVALTTFVTIAAGSLAASLGFQLNEQKHATIQAQTAADTAFAQCDQLTAEVEVLTEKLASEEKAAQAAANNSGRKIAVLEEEQSRLKADLSRAQQELRAAELRGTATSTQLQAVEEKLREARSELAAAVAVQKATAEDAAAAMARSQQLSMALAREKAKGEKAQAEAKARLQAAAKAQADAEDAGIRARTELANTRSRVTRLEADILTRTEQLTALEQDAATAYAHVIELRGQLEAARSQLVAVNTLVGELEAQKTALEGERCRMADELEAERCRVVELHAANTMALQDAATLIARVSGLEEELSCTTEHLNAYKAELHAETATSKALQVQVAALQDRVAQAAQQLAAAEAATAAVELRFVELSQQATDLQSQVEQADARAAESQAVRGATSIELAAAISRVRDLEQQMDRLAGHLEKNEAELEVERSARHGLRNRLDELQELHLKLEATAKNLKTSQEATARDLVDSQGKLRELEAQAEKQREKARHYKQEAECAAAELASVRDELDKTRSVTTAANAKVAELSTMIANYEARSKDLDKKVQDAATREAGLLRAADTSKTALTKMEHDAQAIRREMAENSMRAVQMKHENADLRRTVEELQAKLDKVLTDPDKSLGLEQQVAHLQDELALAQSFQAQVEDLRQQLALRDRQLEESVRNLSRLQAMLGNRSDGELGIAVPVTVADPTVPSKSEVPGLKKARASSARNTARRGTVERAVTESAAVFATVDEGPSVDLHQPEVPAVATDQVKRTRTATMKSASQVMPVKREV
ncbi:hypothetical protein VaNZ11_005609 [Volvox africanus]|uniref:Uncharacterized protein n=1 Tax=Volvox africanus TaxID=51714 RepID=A0ABQ5S042_9CHLO|nr:hypothetical protein VaNZ11_005609 [Volvox africanus]